MTLHDFIFTKKKPGRYFRHIAFWIAQYVFWIFWAGSFFVEFRSWLTWNFKLNGYYILEIVYTYLVVYYFSSKFLVKKKYLKFGISLFFMTVFIYIPYIFYRLWAYNLFNGNGDERLLMTWYYSMNFIINGPPVVCAMFLTFKMFKNYYLKMEEKKNLIQENTNAELQLLKAQIHPHFLFNTLNNIYSFTLKKSPQAGGLVLKLSDTLKYMINDCEAPLVPLEKELKMIEDYIGLEKVRYGDRLEMQLEIAGDYKNKLIAPLLLIPFVENSFKHGSSKMLKRPWIKLYVSIKKNELYMDLSNSRPLQVSSLNGRNGIGLKNVQKRLKLLYPEQHELIIRSADEEFYIHLQIPLLPMHVNVPAENTKQIISASQSLSYV